MPAFLQTTLTEMEIREPKHGLPLVADDNSLAFHLGIRNKTLWYLVRGAGIQAGNAGSVYRLGSIPKRGRAGQMGERRVLHIPDWRLKNVQKALCAAFVHPIPVGPQVRAYEPGSSVLGTAETMSGGGLLLSMDLKNFFGSIRMSWVKHYFRTVGYSHDIASLLARLCCCKDGPINFMPQGTCVSPALANRIAEERVDGAVLKLCTEYGWEYVRYSDNVYFTHPDVLDIETTNAFKDKVKEAFTRGGWRVHKIKVTPKWRQQKVLGLVVNEKPNLARDQYYALRALIHNCYTDGFQSQVAVAQERINPKIKCAEDLISHIRGKLSYVGQVLLPARRERLEEEFDSALEVERLRIRNNWEAEDNQDKKDAVSTD